MRVHHNSFMVNYLNFEKRIKLKSFFVFSFFNFSYFKPNPYCTTNEELGSCTLQLPNSCPVQTITIMGNTKSLKQLACLEACKKLHQVGALTDNLVPDIVEEEAEAKESGIFSSLMLENIF